MHQRSVCCTSTGPGSKGQDGKGDMIPCTSQRGALPPSPGQAAQKGALQRPASCSIHALRCPSSHRSARLHACTGSHAVLCKRPSRRAGCTPMHTQGRRDLYRVLQRARHVHVCACMCMHACSTAACPSMPCQTRCTLSRTDRGQRAEGTDRGHKVPPVRIFPTMMLARASLDNPSTRQVPRPLGSLGATTSTTTSGHESFHFYPYGARR